MTLNDADRQTIKGALLATKSQPYAEAWKDSDLDKLTDNELIGFKNYLAVVKPMYEGIPVPTGGKMVLNQGTGQWELQGGPTSVPDPTKTVFVPTPTSNASQPPASMQEYLDRYGKPEERELWAGAVATFNEAKAAIIGQLVGNMQDPQRTEVVKSLSGMKIEQLKAMLAIVPAASPAQVTPAPAPTANSGGVGNYFAGLGIVGPAVPLVVNNVPKLSTPKLDWKAVREDNGVTVPN